MNGLDFIALVPIVVACAACAVCAATDLRRFRVPNAVTLPLLASGPIYHAATAGWPGLWLALAGLGFGFAALIVPHILGLMGAGDVKLLAGLGAWLGRPMTADILIAALIVAGVYSLLLLILTGRLGRLFTLCWGILARGKMPAEMPVREAVARPDQHGRLVPFAAMMALGLLAAISRL